VGGGLDGEPCPLFDTKRGDMSERESAVEAVALFKSDEPWETKAVAETAMAYQQRS